MASIVHCGWMTKSPPERKLRKQFRIFRSWKKRYFVLRKPSGSLPDQYELHYYKDQRCHHKKGSIDLDQCQQIIEALDSEVFPYLLAIKTSYKQKVRTYYLATDSEHDMNTWVKWLCHVCGLRPEDQPTDIPEPKPGDTAPSAGTANTSTNGASPSPSRHSQSAVCSPLSTLPRTKGGQQSVRIQPLASTGSESSLAYKPLEKGSARPHKPTGRHDSAERTADKEAPPLPQKRQGGHSNGVLAHDGEVVVTSVYDHPPAHRSVDVSGTGLYKYPPASTLQDSKNFVDDAGRGLLPDVPFCHGQSPHACLSAPSDSWTSEGISVQTVNPRDGCDCPKPYNQSTTSSDCEIPPERPPKPSYLTSPYQNLPAPGNTSASTDLMCSIPAPTRAPQLLTMTGYDIPRLSGGRLPHPDLTHVPAAHSRQASPSALSHTYFNTSSQPGSFELPMDSLGRHVLNQSSSFPQAQQAILPSRAGIVGEPLHDRSHTSVYQSPPSSSASSLSSGSPGNPRTAACNGSPASSQVQDKGSSSIFSTKRTRSFKSPHSLKTQVIRESSKCKTLSLSVTVPAPRPVLLPRPREMTNSDEELQPHNLEEETHHSLSLLHSVPAPSPEADRELKYIDLAHPESSQETFCSPQPHGHHAHSHTDRGKEAATEYREIDFVKTQALSDTKRQKERRNDDQN